MSSCAVSCCLCSRKVSCASETSASWPTANVPPPCHFAFSCSARHHKPSKRSPELVGTIFGPVPVRWPDARYRKVYRRSNPTPFSTATRYYCRMKRRSISRNFCVSRLASYPCVFLSNKSLFQGSRAHLFTALLAIQQLFFFPFEWLCPAAHPRGIATPTLSSFQIA
jgi:hypothetical protein